MKPRYRKGHYLHIDTGAVIYVGKQARRAIWERIPIDAPELTKRVEPERWYYARESFSRKHYPIEDLTPDIWARLISLEEAARVVREHLATEPIAA